MLRRYAFAVIACTTLAIAAATTAQAQTGTAAEAKAMLEKAIAAVKADKAKAIGAFNSPTGGFKDRDLYVFCANVSDGIITAGPEPVRGKKMQDLKDKTGKAFGEEMAKVAAEGSIAEVAYMFPKPGQTEPSPKVSFVTKVADQVCGVGYYK